MMPILSVLLCWLLLISNAYAAPAVGPTAIASSAAALTLTTGAINVAAGSTVVICVFSKSNTSATVTTSTSETVTLIDAGNASPASGSVKSGYVMNTTGSATFTATVEWGGGTPTGVIAVVALTGVATTGVLDVTATANTTPAASSMSSGATAATAEADELAVACLFSDSALATATLTPASGFTGINSQTDGATKPAFATAYKAIPTSAAVTSTWNTDSTTGRTGVYVFKSAPAATSNFFSRRRAQ